MFLEKRPANTKEKLISESILQALQSLFEYVICRNAFDARSENVLEPIKRELVHRFYVREVLYSKVKYRGSYGKFSVIFSC